MQAKVYSKLNQANILPSFQSGWKLNFEDLPADPVDTSALCKSISDPIRITFRFHTATHTYSHQPWWMGKRWWLYKGYLVYTRIDGCISDEQERLLAMDAVLRHEKRFARLAKIVSLSEQLDACTDRESIPEEVRIYVWRRDDGKCVKCGSQENLEFDHIIPHSKGGSNSARNIQILCEQCNRQKTDHI